MPGPNTGSPPASATRAGRGPRARPPAAARRRALLPVRPHDLHARRPGASNDSTARGGPRRPRSGRRILLLFHARLCRCTLADLLGRLSRPGSACLWTRPSPAPAARRPSPVGARVARARPLSAVAERANGVAVTESAASSVTQTVALTVDGHPVTVPEGSSILAAAREVGVTIPTLCYHDTLHVASACRLCIVEVQGRKDPVTACDTPAADGMVITTQSPELRAIRQLNLELIFSDHMSYCTPPCRDGCPTHIKIPGFLERIADRDYAGGMRVLRQDLPFPGILGRVCPRPCEGPCRRQLVDDPITICQLHRFMADQTRPDELEGELLLPAEPKPDSGKKIAIVGGGPAGLAAAFYARLEGHAVKIFEAQPKAGRHAALRHPVVPPAARHPRGGDQHPLAHGRRDPDRRAPRHRLPARGAQGRVRRGLPRPRRLQLQHHERPRRGRPRQRDRRGLPRRLRARRHRAHRQEGHRHRRRLHRHGRLPHRRAHGRRRGHLPLPALAQGDARPPHRGRRGRGGGRAPGPAGGAGARAHRRRRQGARHRDDPHGAR